MHPVQMSVAGMATIWDMMLQVRAMHGETRHWSWQFFFSFTIDSELGTNMPTAANCLLFVLFVFRNVWNTASATTERVRLHVLWQRFEHLSRFHQSAFLFLQKLFIFIARVKMEIAALRQFKRKIAHFLITAWNRRVRGRCSAASLWVHFTTLMSAIISCNLFFRNEM